MYEMDLRQYDPAIARWVAQDPVIHYDFSPYSAFDNNPAFWADPSGADAVKITDANGNVVGGDFNGQDKDNLYNNLVGNTDNFEAELRDFYSFESNKDQSGGGSSSGNGNGDGNGNGNNSTKYTPEQIKKINERNKRKIDLLKATDLAFTINSGLKVSKYVTGVTSTTLPVLEFGAITYKYVNSDDLVNNYTKGEYIYDSSGILVGATIGYMTGQAVGGPYGAAAGIIVGVTFQSVKAAYHKVGPEIIGSYNNFIN